ncbi:MAG: hypothetical protein ABIK33_03110 [candidate division WOR-3 bacterium]
MFKQKYLIIILTLLISLIWAENNLITINNYPTTNAITIPKLLNYQGKLTNLAGQPVTDSIYSITFRLYNVSLGGSEFWTETQNVQTNQGIFNVILGSVNPIESIPQSGNCYLEMQVNPNPAMTPRIRITSSAYAYLAKKADTANYAIATNVQYVDSAGVSANAHKLQGKDTVALDLRYVNENQSNAITTTMIVNNAVDNTKLSANAVTTDKIQDNTITRNDVALNFKAPYADTADYTRNVNVQYVDSARIAANAHNAYKLQGKDTVALSNKFVDEGQTNAITSVMIVDNAITSAKIQDGTIQLIDLAFTPATRPLTPPVSNAEIQDNAITSSKIQDGTILRQDVASNFKSPYADTADYVRNVSIQYVDSARIAVDAHNAYKLQGKDTVALSAKFVDEGQPNAITNQMIVNDAITSAKIQDGAIQLDDLSFTPAVRPFSPLISGSEIARPCTLEADVAQYDAVLNVNNTGSGFAIKASANSDAVIVDNAGGAGFVVNNAEHDGYFVGHTNWCGVYVDSADDCGIIISKVAHEGVYIDRAHGAGVFVFNSNGDAFVTHSAGDNGLRVTSAYNHGVLIGRPGQDGLYVDSAGRFGVYVQGAEGGVYGKSDDGFGVKAQSTSGTALIVEGTSEFTGQITSTATDRTAPISVASTAVCPNLNADLLDGYHASELMGTGVYLPLAGGTMTGPITNTGDPEITMGKGNFGSGNINSGTMAFVAGKNNRARGDYSVVSGGGGPTLADSNSAIGYYATVCGGTANSASGWGASVGGGWGNWAKALYATVSGGAQNYANYSRATVSGGQGNIADNEYATIGGGSSNRASGLHSTVCGGNYNCAFGEYATVAGGRYDTSYGYCSFTTNYASCVPSAFNNSAAFNGQTASASGQLRCGALVGNSKSFQIDHPLDPNGKFLNHFSVESPKMLVTYDGVAIIGSDGRVKVNLPDYFSALTKEPRIQLTGVGTSDVYVAEDINGNQFVIGGKPNTKVYWQVSAERKDISAEITKILMPVEQEKTGELQNVSADDNYLMSTLDQLKAMGYGDRFNFRTAKGRARYEHMHKIEHEVEIKH